MGGSPNLGVRMQEELNRKMYLAKCGVWEICSLGLWVVHHWGRPARYHGGLAGPTRPGIKGFHSICDME